MVRPARFEIRREDGPSAIRLMVEGELDLSTAPRLVESARGALEETPEQLAIDLRELSFADSTGLRALMEINELAGTTPTTLSMLAPPGEAFTVFRISGAADHLPFREG